MSSELAGCLTAPAYLPNTLSDDEVLIREHSAWAFEQSAAREARRTVTPPD